MGAGDAGAVERRMDGAGPHVDAETERKPTAAASVRPDVRALAVPRQRNKEIVYSGGERYVCIILGISLYCRWFVPDEEICLEQMLDQRRLTKRKRSYI